MILNWKATREDYQTITAIVDRLDSITKGRMPNRLGLMMDLNACYSNGCPLDLAGLLASNQIDFIHDIYGISRHINRDTGQLENGFTPRYALANRVAH